MGRECRYPSRREELLRQPEERRIHISLVLMRDVSRFLVGALTQAHPRPQVEDTVEVAHRSV